MALCGRCFLNGHLVCNQEQDYSIPLLNCIASENNMYYIAFNNEVRIGTSLLFSILLTYLTEHPNAHVVYIMNSYNHIHLCNW